MVAFARSTRSTSFPPRVPENCPHIEEALNELKDELLSKTSMSNQLVGLAKLYSRMNELIRSPSTQHAYCHQEHGDFIEEALDGSVGLLDLCNSMRELTLQLREQVRDLQSVLRRKGYLNIENEVSVYMGFRKKMTKGIVKCLGGMKRRDNISSKFELVAAFDLAPQLAHVVDLQREVCDVTIGAFQSLCSFLSMPKRAIGWGLISKLVTRGSPASPSRNEEVCNEVMSVDSELYQLYRHGGNVSQTDVKVVQGRLQTLDARLQHVEGELERISRLFVENRVSLLNILTGLSLQVTRLL